ncbi:hypothetical protein D8S78_07475 [Natrialba swarupiae]|nr:hypothetical protein [Natrialba swarupiae]
MGPNRRYRSDRRGWLPLPAGSTQRRDRHRRYERLHCRGRTRPRRTPDVADVSVIGVPHEEWGEAVRAVVVPREDSPPVDVDDILEYAGERLAGYKRPKSVEVAAELPTTSIGKIDKATLRDRHWADEDRRIG